MGAKVIVLPGAFHSEVWDLFDEAGYIPTSNIDDTARAIVFTGGTDISTDLYHQQPIKGTQTPDTSRDIFECKLFRAFEGKMLMIGICRGAQLLNVLNGGSLWQDVDGHELGGYHVVRDHWRHRELLVTSLHHQMMRPTKDAQLLLTTNLSSLRRDQFGKVEVEKIKLVGGKFLPEVRDIEAVYYEKTKSFCIQSHPEISNAAEKEFFFEFIDHIGM